MDANDKGETKQLSRDAGERVQTVHRVRCPSCGEANCVCYCTKSETLRYYKCREENCGDRFKVAVQ